MLSARKASLLDTGGGVRAALERSGADPFFVVNGDAFWLNGPTPALRRLADAFDADGGRRAAGAPHLPGPRRNRLRRFRGRQLGRAAAAARAGGGAVYLRRRPLIAPALLDGMPDGRVLLNRAWDRAMEAGRLRAVVHDGIWFHLSTPADLAEAEQVLEARITGDDTVAVALNLFAIPPHVAVPRRRWRAGWLRERRRRSAGSSRNGLILPPTRRAARALAEAFLRVRRRRGRCCCRASSRLGALDEAPLALAGALDLPPAVEPPQRWPC